MNICYKYSKLNIICSYFGYLGIGILGVGLLFLYAMGIPKALSEWLVLSLGYSPFLLMLLAVIIWTITALKIRIYVNDSGLEYISPFRKVKIKWQDIVNIQKKYFYSGGYPSYGPPKDLEIRTRENKKVKIYYFIVRCEQQKFDLSRASDENIKEFEAEIRKHTKIEF